MFSFYVFTLNTFLFNVFANASEGTNSCPITSPDFLPKKRVLWQGHMWTCKHVDHLCTYDEVEVGTSLCPVIPHLPSVPNGIPSEFFVMQGDCTMNPLQDNCISSKDFPTAYTMGQTCMVKMLIDAMVVNSTFDIDIKASGQGTLDELRIKNVSIIRRYQIPQHLHADDTITWNSDESQGLASGWQLCFDYPISGPNILTSNSSSTSSGVFYPEIPNIDDDQRLSDNCCDAQAPTLIADACNACSSLIFDFDHEYPITEECAKSIYTNCYFGAFDEADCLNFPYDWLTTQDNDTLHYNFQRRIRYVCLEFDTRLSELPDEQDGGYTIIDGETYTREGLYSNTSLIVRNSTFIDLEIAITIEGAPLIIENSYFEFTYSLNVESTFIESDDRVEIRNCTFRGIESDQLQYMDGAFKAQFLYIENSIIDAYTKAATFNSDQTIIINSTISKGCASRPNGLFFSEFIYLEGVNVDLEFSDTSGELFLPTNRAQSNAYIHIVDSNFSNIYSYQAESIFVKDASHLYMERVRFTNITAIDCGNFLQVDDYLFMEDVVFESIIVQGITGPFLIASNVIEMIRTSFMGIGDDTSTETPSISYDFIQTESAELHSYTDVHFDNMRHWAKYFEADTHVLFLGVYLNGMEFTNFFNVGTNKLTIDGMYICCDTITGKNMLQGAVLEANAFEMIDSDPGIAPTLYFDNIRCSNCVFANAKIADTFITAVSSMTLVNTRIESITGNGLFARSYLNINFEGVTYRNSDTRFVAALGNIFLENVIVDDVTTSGLLDGTNISIYNMDATLYYEEATTIVSKFFNINDYGSLFLDSVTIVYKSRNESDPPSNLLALMIIAGQEISVDIQSLYIECEGFAILCHSETTRDNGALANSNFACELCAVDEYSLPNVSITITSTNYTNNRPVCLSCPFGAICDGTSNIVFEDGFWAIGYENQIEDATCARSDSIYYELETYRCPPGYCEGGECVSGREGILCGKCKEGYSQGWGVPECFEEKCDPTILLIMNIAYALGISYLTVHAATDSSEGESSDVFKIIMVIFQACNYAELPYPAVMEGAIRSIIGIFSFSALSSGDDNGTCFAEGHTTVGGIFLNLFGVSVTIFGIVVLCIYHKIHDTFTLTSIATLTIFLTISPLFDVMLQIFGCKELIVDTLGTKELRAFYFAEVKCYAYYQIIFIVLFVLISCFLLLIMILHYLRNADKISDGDITRAVFHEMEKPFVEDNQLSRLWGYLLIFYRIYMMIAHVIIGHQDGIVGACFTLFGTGFFVVLHAANLPYKGKISNYLSVVGYTGVSLLCAFQLSAETQIRIGDFSDSTWVERTWTYTFIATLAVMTPAAIHTVVMKLKDKAESSGLLSSDPKHDPEDDLAERVEIEDEMSSMGGLQSIQSLAGAVEMSNFDSEKSPQIRQIWLEGALFSCACFPSGDAKCNVTIIDGPKIGMQLFGLTLGQPSEPIRPEDSMNIGAPDQPVH